MEGAYVCQGRPAANIQALHPDDLYVATLKPTEVRLLTAMAAEKGFTIYKIDTKQAFLYGDMGSDRILIRPRDWWPESLKPGQVLQAVLSVYRTKQAPRCWHTRVSTWIEENGYLPVNHEKTIFLKWGFYRSRIRR